MIIYTDATMDPIKKKNEFGLLIKNSNRALVATWAIPILERVDPTVMKACAIRKAMLKVLEENWTSIYHIIKC